VSRYQIYQDRSYQYRNSYQGFIGLLETYGDKNAFRMTSYHRLDFNISFHRQKKKHDRTWSFGAYNAYWHKNPYFIYSSKTPSEETAYKEVSLIPFAIPYFSYAFKF
ncbi:MAG: hypothetical protein KDC53_13335, partial [Saprospiraceae bacterium]|nr:hypothetical protein [Saprospiraceae bacterium]